MVIFKTDFVCMCNHAHNNIRDTRVVNIYIFIHFLSIFITCEHKRKIMLENTEHNVNDILFIISKLTGILSHSRWIIGSYRANFSARKIFNRICTSFTLFR